MSSEFWEDLSSGLPVEFTFSIRMAGPNRAPALLYITDIYRFIFGGQSVIFKVTINFGNAQET